MGDRGQDAEGLEELGAMWDRSVAERPIVPPLYLTDSAQSGRQGGGGGLRRAGGVCGTTPASVGGHRAAGRVNPSSAAGRSLY